MTVADNMGFALRTQRLPKDEIARRIKDAAKLLDLEEFLDRKPKNLSGGQRQRVAMGRAIVREPQVFCMDEPLSNLDAKLRVSTRTQIADLQSRLRVTTVYVTHDQVEAMTMGDRVAVMREGLLQQCDTPLNLYERPGNVFVAGFIGSPAMNLETRQIQDDSVRLSELSLKVPRVTLDAVAAEGSQEVVLGFRPESVQVVREGEGFPLHVSVVEELGADAFAYGTIEAGRHADGAGKRVIVRVDSHNPPAKNSRIFLQIRPGAERYFSAKTGAALQS
jgi:multiple sugar transport system ATP-binding protein